MITESTSRIRKCASGINGFDQIFDGGLPTGRTTLIVGGPGTGKSLFGLEFLYRGALAGEAGVFVSFEERTSALRENAATLGWQLDPLEKSGKLFLLEGRTDPKAVMSGGLGIQPFLIILEAKLKAMGAKRVVIDALDVLLRLVGDSRREQDEMLIMHRWLEDRGVTALLTVKATRGNDHEIRFDFLDYLADCVVHLDNRAIGQLSTRRLRVIKYRGSGFGSNEYPYVIGPPGITLLPISSVELSHLPLGDRFSSGLPALDTLIGGGFRRASSVLIAGSTGTGKTTLCASFVRGACAAGEKVLYIDFEESEPALVSTMRSAGIDLAPALKAGTLRMLTGMPEAMGAEQQLVRTCDAIRQLQASCVVLESASACKRMGTEQAAFEYLMRLINTCKEQGITILLTNQIAGFIDQEEISDIGISSLIDAVLLLRLVEDAGALRRQLLIMKSRGTPHSLRYHEYAITDDGIQLVKKEV